MENKCLSLKRVGVRRGKEGERREVWRRDAKRDSWDRRSPPLNSALSAEPPLDDDNKNNRGNKEKGIERNVTAEKKRKKQ